MWSKSSQTQAGRRGRKRRRAALKVRGTSKEENRMLKAASFILT